MREQTQLSIDIDWSRIEKEVEKKSLTSQKALALSVIEDTEDFVPFMTGTLYKSVNEASDVEHGEVAWDTPYARHLYYGIHYKSYKPMTFNRVSHHHASAFWFENAKAVYLDKWKRQVEEIFKK